MIVFCCFTLSSLFVTIIILVNIVVVVIIIIIVSPMLAVDVDGVAEKSPRRGREARVPCSRRDGRRKPSRVIP